MGIEDDKKEDITQKLIQKIKYILRWTHTTIELNEAYFNQMSENRGKPHVSSGEIYYADMGTNVGAEIDKERPVLIFQNDDRYIRYSNLVFVIPVASNTEPGPYKIFIKPEHITENDGGVEGALFIQQAKSISKNRLKKYKGRLCESKLKEVLIEFNKFIYKNNPLLAEGDAQRILMDSAKNIL